MGSDLYSFGAAENIPDAKADEKFANETAEEHSKIDPATNRMFAWFVKTEELKNLAVVAQAVE